MGARQIEASPLEVVEATVQARAKDLDLDTRGGSAGGRDGREALRALVDAAIEDWAVDYRHGLRDFPLADPETVADRALRNLVGYGPLDPLLADDDVWEIMINGPAGSLAR